MSKAKSEKIYKAKASKKELESADNCKLPSVLPDVCKRCRCYAYCHRQMTIFDFIDE